MSAAAACCSLRSLRARAIDDCWQTLTVRGVKRIAAVIGTAFVLFALGFTLVRDNGRDTQEPRGVTTYSTTYMITAYEVRPANPPSPLDGSDLPTRRPR